MNWTDQALILDVAPMGEGSAKVTVFSENHGVHSGFVRGIRSKQNKSILHRGNLVKATWNARLEDHLGQFNFDLIHSYGTNAVLSRDQLEAINVLCAMILSCLHERQSFVSIYQSSLILLQNMEGLYDFAILYQKWEFGLLKELGFGLELDKCAATGVSENLCYVSPKSGKAVSLEAAEPFKNKLLVLPDYLLVENHHPEIPALMDGFKLSGFFIEKWILTPKNQTLPAARFRILDRLLKLDRM